MVAITVLLAATSATFFFDLGDGMMGERTPQAAFGFDYDAGSSADALTIEHRSGDTVQAGSLYISVSGASAAAGNPNGNHDLTDLDSLGPGSKITAGSRITFESSDFGGSDLDLSGATVTINWKSPDSDRSIQLATWEAP